MLSREETLVDKLIAALNKYIDKGDEYFARFKYGIGDTGIDRAKKYKHTLNRMYSYQDDQVIGIVLTNLNDTTFGTSKNLRSMLADVLVEYAGITSLSIDNLAKAIYKNKASYSQSGFEITKLEHAETAAKINLLNKQFQLSVTQTTEQRKDADAFISGRSLGGGAL